MKVYLDTIGCRLNQAEIESMAREFRERGHEIVAMAENADLAVVNTCAVTAAAASDSRGTIRRLARVRDIPILATGCWATLQPLAAAALPAVARVVPNRLKDQLVNDVLEAPAPRFEIEPIARIPLPGPRHRTRVFIKVQDGCNNRCAFCITTLARGVSRSRSLAEVLMDVRAAAAGEAQEIVLTGVQLVSWGRDVGLGLEHLVQAILHETPVPRVRLSSLEPWDLDAQFFSLWEDARMCRHLHLPLQSGCDATLRRMGRKTTRRDFVALVNAAREAIPEVAITTDVIAGFPGETEAEFEESLDFVRELGLAGGHAFAYSARPGTVAARLPGHVAPRIRKERSNAFRCVFEQAAGSYRERFLGRTATVLWESALRTGGESWRLEGLTDNFIRVTCGAPEPRWNRIDRVVLRRGEAGGLEGIIAKSG